MSRLAGRARVAGAAGLVVAACSGGEAPASLVTVDTLEGGAVRVRSPDAGRWAVEGGAWSARSVLDLGSPDGTDAFGKVSAIALADGERAYVADEHQGRIHVVDLASGAVTGTLGRPGRGPGEMGRPDGLAVDGEGRLWVSDWRTDRYTVFDLARDRVETRPRRLRGGSDGHLAFGPDGRLLDHTHAPSSWDPRFFVPALVRLAPPGRSGGSGGPADTLVLPWRDPPTFPRVRARSAGSVAMEPTVPFAPRVAWAYDPVRGGVWTAVGDAYRLRLLGWDGSVRRVLERSGPALEVTPAERDAALGELEAAWPGFRFDPDAVPERKPYLRWIAADEAGRLWVGVPGPADASGERVDVFDAAGTFLGSLALPGRVTDPDRVRLPPVVRGGVLAGVVRDHLDVEHLVAYRVGPPAG